MGTVPEAHTSPKAQEDRPWDWHGTDEARKGDMILKQGGWPAFAQAHAWYDATMDEDGNDPPHQKQAYKLPHHEIVSGRMRVVWNGVRAAMQVLAGARGGVEIPEGDRKDVYRHLEQHFREFDKEPPAFDELGG